MLPTSQDKMKPLRYFSSAENEGPGVDASELL